MHHTMSIRNAIIISHPDSERGYTNWMLMEQQGPTREMTAGEGKLRGPS